MATPRQVELTVNAGAGDVTCSASKAIQLVRPTGETSEPAGRTTTVGGEPGIYYLFNGQLTPVDVYYGGCRVGESLGRVTTDTMSLPDQVFVIDVGGTWALDVAGEYGPDYMGIHDRFLEMRRMQVPGLLGVYTWEQVMTLNPGTADLEYERHAVRYLCGFRDGMLPWVGVMRDDVMGEDQ